MTLDVDHISALGSRLTLRHFFSEIPTQMAAPPFVLFDVWEAWTSADPRRCTLSSAFDPDLDSVRRGRNGIAERHGSGFTTTELSRNALLGGRVAHPLRLLQSVGFPGKPNYGPMPASTSGRAASTTSTSGASASGWRNSVTCIAIRSSAAWSSNPT